MTTPEERAAEVLGAAERTRILDAAITSHEQLDGGDVMFAVIEQVIAERFVEARAEERRKGAEEALLGAASDLVADCTNQPGPCICAARHWLRERADTYAEGGER
ncbi:MAG: hypothetical protein ACXVXP_00185 [Mycobacteriaceae bacterium]